MTHQTLNPNGLITLWRQACNGNQDCLAELLTALQDPIYRFCCAQTGDANLAAEATQETAVRIIRSLSSFSERSQITSWAIGIGLNVCREFERNQSRWPQNEPNGPLERAFENSDEDSLEEKESFLRLRQFVSELAPRQREAIVLRYFEEMPINQIAEIMSVSIGTVKATLNQATSNLKRAMKVKS